MDAFTNSINMSQQVLSGVKSCSEIVKNKDMDNLSKSINDHTKSPPKKKIKQDENEDRYKSTRCHTPQNRSKGEVKMRSFMEQFVLKSASSSTTDAKKKPLVMSQAQEKPGDDVKPVSDTAPPLEEVEAELIVLDVSVPEGEENTSIINTSTDSTRGKTPEAKTPKSAAKRAEILAERQKKKEMREKEKADRERKQAEDREKKELEKRRKEQEKKEKQEQLERERKEKAERKEREKQERQQKLDDEKKKKLEEKQKREEEKQKKDEEKQKQDEEKKLVEEKARAQREKTANAFKSFFIQKEPEKEPEHPKYIGPFQAFQVKKNMKLAPVMRAPSLCGEKCNTFDEALQKQDSTNLYFDILKSGDYIQGSSASTRVVEEKGEVEVMEDKSQDKSQDKVDTHKRKLLQFKENYRPPYYGTWRKKSKKLSGRNPFKKDELLFDYTVDSDEEWEEEEPGESLSHSESDDDEEDGGGGEDEDEDKFFVPHGYLSDDEMIDGSEEDGVMNKPDVRLAKQAAFEAHIKRGCQKLRPVLIGPAYDDDDSGFSELLCYQVVMCGQQVAPVATTYTYPTGSVTTSADTSTLASKTSAKNKKPVPEQAMGDLLKSVHGNTKGIKKLVQEFRLFWDTKCLASDGRGVGAETGDGEAGGGVGPDGGGAASGDGGCGGAGATPGGVKYSISMAQLEAKIREVAVRERQPDRYSKVCWYVRGELLDRYGLTDLPVPHASVVVAEAVAAEHHTPTHQPPHTPAANSLLKFTKAMSIGEIQRQQLLAVSQPPTPQDKGGKVSGIMKYTSQAKPALVPASQCSLTSPATAT